MKRKLLDLDHRQPIRTFKTRPRTLQAHRRTIQDKTVWRLYHTEAQARQALESYLSAGYKYFVGWRNTGPMRWGLQCARSADWQTPDSPVYSNLWNHV